MKCLLCKGRGGFLVYKIGEFNPFLGGSDYYAEEPCPRCNGTKNEEYISSRRKRMTELMHDYGHNYNKYFKLKTNHDYDEILNSI